MNEIYDYYITKSNNSQEEAGKLKRKIHLMGTIRLLLILGLAVLIWIFIEQSISVLIAITTCVIIPFVWLMVLHNKLSSRKAYVETMAELCSAELRGLDYDFSAFDGADEKSEAEHSFALDLDIFGKNSLFQSLNRTIGHGGRELLAERFSTPLSDKNAILKRQEAVKELSRMTDIRQHFTVTGMLNKGEKNDVEILTKLTSDHIDFARKKIWNTMTFAIPAIWIIGAAGYFSGVINEPLLSAFFIVSLLVANCKVKKITALHNSVNKVEGILKTYALLMEIIEEKEFESETLREIKGKLISGEVSASKAVKELSRRLGTLDQRANLVVVILNIFVLWDIRCAIRIERWKSKHGSDIGQWFEALIEFDTMVSMAGFAFNHPDYIYPTISDEYFTFKGKSLGHPLMNRKVCVRNDISIDSDPYFMIITGANMAGKSTYLRTIGTNFLLACVGMPVCAKELTLYPAHLVTSLRTSDSLTNNESYFFAELKRLKMIIDRLASGEKLFIILDEILKGTNSTDKQKGSLALIRQLISYKTCGIIATHDLVLGTLHEEYPQWVKNLCFEADIVNDELKFSYKLREGIAQNMNACFLMNKMGITVR